MNELTDKTALVTGGSKGIGYGIAETLIHAGMRVAITGRNAQSAKEAAERLNEIRAGAALAVQADVRDLKAQSEAVNQTLEQWGHLDAVIANAGVGHFGSIEDLTPEIWQESIDTNLTGVFNSIKASVEALKKSKGYFISIASLAGTNFFAGGSAYNASKFGVVGFSQAIMLDLRHHGIKVTTIMPGSVTSHFNGHVPDEKDSWKIQPVDIGELVVDLLKMHPRTLPSKIEVRPSMPPQK